MINLDSDSYYIPTGVVTSAQSEGNLKELYSNTRSVIQRYGSSTADLADVTQGIIKQAQRSRTDLMLIGNSRVFSLVHRSGLTDSRFEELTKNLNNPLALAKSGASSDHILQILGDTISYIPNKETNKFVLIDTAINGLRRPEGSVQHEIDNLRKMILLLKQRQPDAQIVICSLLPVAADYAMNNSADAKLVNQRVKAFNQLAFELSRAHSIPFLNTTEELKRHPRYDPDVRIYSKDGLHLNTYGLDLVTTVLDSSIPKGESVIRKGSGRRDDIRQLQSDLNRLGYPVGPVDGLFGHKTQNALIAFQKDNYIYPSGEYGSTTDMYLQIALERRSRAVRSQSD